MRPLFWCKIWIMKKTHKRVFSGSFRGLKYVSEAYGSAYYPKLLGTYEKELQGTLNKVILQKPETVLIIGAGEGYYSAGIAKLLPDSFIHSFETIPSGQLLIQKMCRLNDITNVKINGEFQLDKHYELIGQSDLIIVDIEGDEVMLLEKYLFENSKKNWIIEIHGSEILQLIQQEAHLFFNVEWIPVAKRTLRDIPADFLLFLPGIFNRYWLSLLQEWRTDSLGWLILQPKQRAQ